jgi:hypothetical protein
MAQLPAWHGAPQLSDSCTAVEGLLNLNSAAAAANLYEHDLLVVGQRCVPHGGMPRQGLRARPTQAAACGSAAASWPSTSALVQAAACVEVPFKNNK